MKTRLLSAALWFTCALPFLCRSQNPVYKEATLARPAEFWNSLKLSDDGGNTRDGVQFYIHGAECGSENVKLLKLVNRNPYAMKVSYQLSDASSVVSFTVPPSASIEGSCKPADENLAKLALKTPVANTDEEKKKNAEFIRSHITVSRAQ